MSSGSIEPVLLVECIAQPQKQNQQVFTSSCCLRARQPGCESQERRQALRPEKWEKSTAGSRQTTRVLDPLENFDTTWLDVTKVAGQSHVREIDFENYAEIVLIQHTPTSMWVTPRCSKYSGISTMRHNRTQTGAQTAYTNFHIDTPSLPRSTTKAVFGEECLRAVTCAAQCGWSVERQAKRPAAKNSPRATCEGRGGTSTTFLRTAAKSRVLGWKVASSFLNLASVAGGENCPPPCSSVLDQQGAQQCAYGAQASHPGPHQCIACVPLPTHRHATRLVLQFPSLARAILAPKTDVHMRDCPGRRHTWVAPALCLPRARRRLKTFDSIGLVLSEVAQAIVHPPSASATAVWSRAPAHQPPNVSSWYSGCALFRAAKLPCCCSAIVEVQLHPWKSWTVSINCLRLKPTCIRSQHCDAMGSKGRSAVTQLNLVFLDITTRQRPTGTHSLYATPCARCSGTTHAPRQ